jgi:formylglycine-generating enzyme required for sulfatase activity
MHGNVSEWVENCYQYRDARADGRPWRLDCTTQTVRGGSLTGATRVARSFASYTYSDNRIGFRIARTE